MEYWIISVLAGAIGGTIAGRIFYKISLGKFINSIVGALFSLIAMEANITFGFLGSMNQTMKALVLGDIIGFLSVIIIGLALKATKKK